MAKGSRKPVKLLLVVCSVLVLITILVVLSYRFSVGLLKTKIEESLGTNVTARSVEIGWNRIAIKDLVFTRGGAVVGRMGEIEVRPDFLTFLKYRAAISSVTVTKAYFLLEIDRSGNLLLPVALPEKKEEKEAPSKPFPIEVTLFSLKEGSVQFVDRTRPKAPPVRMENLAITARNITYPAADTPVAYDLSAELAGPGKPGALTGSGTTSLAKSETKAKLLLRNMDLTILAPYVTTEADVDIAKGRMDLDADISLKGRYIRVPALAVLKELEFREGQGVKNTFLGVPRSMVLALLKSGNNEIRLDFVVEGDLNNPKFSLREGVAKRFTVAIASKLGLPIKELGETAVVGGAKILKETTKTITDFFKGKR